MKKAGFTLAEVLITLVIIGVIAAMTVPTLLNNTNSQEFRSALKKAVSTLNNAVSMEYALNSLTMADFSTAEDYVTQVFSRRMKTMDATMNPSAIAGHLGNCWATVDGAFFCIDIANRADCDVQHSNDGNCATIYVDVNGQRNPNHMTTSANNPRDGYTLTLRPNGVVPGDDVTAAVMFDQEVAGITGQAE